MGPEPRVTFGFPLVANQRLWNVFQLAVPWSSSSNSGCHIRAEPLSQMLQRTLQSPSARDHQLEFRDLAQCALQHWQAAEVLRFMAMLWVQDSIKIQKQYGHVDDSSPAFQQPLNFC